MSVKSDSAISLKTDDIDWTNPRLPISRALRKEYVLVVFAAEKIEPGPDVTLHFDISIWRGPLPFGLPRPAFRPVTRWNVRLTVSAFGIGDGRIIVLFEEGNAARFCFQFRATVSELAVCHVSPGRIVPFYDAEHASARWFYWYGLLVLLVFLMERFLEFIGRFKIGWL